MRSLSQIIRGNQELTSVVAKHPELASNFRLIGQEGKSESSQDVKYTGHHPVHVGLQAHSVSGDYPWATQGRGYGDLTLFQPVNHVEGIEGPLYARNAQAQAAYQAFRETGVWPEEGRVERPQVQQY